MKADRLKLYSISSIVFIIGFSVLSVLQLNKLRFDYSFESFFPINDPELAYYEQFIDAFGQQNDFLFVAFDAVDLQDTAQLSDLAEIERSLELMPEIVAVQSPFDEQIYQVTPFGLNAIQKYPPTQAIDLTSEQSAAAIGKYFSQSKDAILMVLQHKPFDRKVDADDFYSGLQQWLTSNVSFKTVSSGKIQMQKDFTALLEQELGILLGAGFSICLLILFFLFKSVKRVLYSVLVMALTLLFTLGIMGSLNKPIDVMIVMLPAILFIISLSDSIHLINKYDFHIRSSSPQDAIAIAFNAIGKANLITSLTTAIGFLGLYFIPIKPIRDFGLYAAIGIMIALVITMTLIPALLYFSPAKAQHAEGRKRLDVLTQRMGAFGKKTRWFTVIISSIILLGIFQLKLNTGLIVGLQKDEPMLEKVAYFDQHFNGYRPVEIGIELNNVHPTDSIISYKIEQIEKTLTKELQANGILSTNSIIKKINSALYGGSPNFLKLPKEQDITRIKRFYESKRLEELVNSVSSDAPPLIRMVGLSPDLGSHYFLRQNAKLDSLFEVLNNQEFEARLTGNSYLIDKTDRYVIEALLKGLGFACLTVMLITLLFYRSWPTSLLILLVNIIPLALLFGLMGLLGIDLNISTAIIFTVAFGIAVDDSIHLISRYRLEREAGKSKEDALSLAKHQTGKSILFTTIAISLGFGVLIGSGFSAVYYLGLFICITALIALWFDLKLLPYLIAKWGIL